MRLLVCLCIRIVYEDCVCVCVYVFVCVCEKSNYAFESLCVILLGFVCNACF